MAKIEIVGLIASVLIVCSMAFKTTTYKGTIFMRILNGLGSIFFVVYGIVLHAWSTALTNVFGLALSIFYLIKETRDHRRNNGIQS